MGYGCGDSFPFDFETNRIPFGSKLKGKLFPRSNPIQCERKGKYSFLSVQTRPNPIYLHSAHPVGLGNIGRCPLGLGLYQDS